jgi:type VI secretion system protein ImpF
MRYTASLFDKLQDDTALTNQRSGQIMTGLTLAQMVSSVAQDLEALLNSRCAFTQEEAQRFPLASASVVNYGIADFSSLTLASHIDRELICTSIAAAIQNQDRRLYEVKVALLASDEAKKTNASKSLNFHIEAMLHLSTEKVSFKARFEPVAQRYSVALDSAL